MPGKGRPPYPQVLAIDPGGEHCGMAGFVDGKCVDAWESDPELCVDQVELWLRSYATVGAILVVEEFRLYPGKAAAQSWSELETVQTIGVLKYLVRMHRLQGGPAVWCQQQATIKTPTKAILRAKGIRSTAKKRKAGNHAFDAELHGYHALAKWLRDYEKEQK